MKVKFLFLILILYSFLTYAHKPINITITRDIEKNQLYIVVKHPKNSSGDYIKKIEILCDERVPIVKKFFFQKGPKKKLTLDILNLEEVKIIVIRVYPKRGKFLEKKFEMDELLSNTDLKIGEGESEDEN